MFMHDRVGETCRDVVLIAQPGGPLVGANKRRPLIEDQVPLVKGLSRYCGDPLHQLLVRLRRVVHNRTPISRLGPLRVECWSGSYLPPRKAGLTRALDPYQTRLTKARWARSVVAAQDREEAQDFEVEPDHRDQKSKSSPPRLLLRYTHPNALLD